VRDGQEVKAGEVLAELEAAATATAALARRVFCMTARRQPFFRLPSLVA